MMRFEVIVDDAVGVPALEVARLEAKVLDMPSFVQSLVDKAVQQAKAKYMPKAISLPEALKKVADLQQQVDDLTRQLAGK